MFGLLAATGVYLSTPPSEDGWVLLIDWDGDGLEESHEETRLQDVSLRRGRQHLISGDGSGFERPAIGEALLTLDNEDGRFDAWNSDSAIYGNVRPGRMLRLKVWHCGMLYPVFTGRLIDVVPQDTDTPTVQLVCHDGYEWLASDKRSVRIGVQTNIRTDEALDLILTAAGWPWARDLGATGSADQRAYWWADQQTALDAIYQLLDAELGEAWIAADGTFTFRGRHEGMGTVSDVLLVGQDVLRSSRLAQPWENIRNAISATAYPRVLQAEAVLWTLSDAPQLAPGESITVTAEWTYDGRVVGGAAMVDPVSTTDYMAHENADGSGLNYTAYLTVALTEYGSTGDLMLTNTHPSGSFYVDFLQVRGQAIDAPAPSTLTAEDAASEAEYGTQSLDLDLVWQQSTYSARDFTRYLLSWLKGAQPFPVLVMESRQWIVYPYEIGSIIKLDWAEKGILQNFRVIGIEHAWISLTGQGIVSTWYLEPITATQFWKWPITWELNTVWAY